MFTSKLNLKYLLIKPNIFYQFQKPELYIKDEPMEESERFNYDSSDSSDNRDEGDGIEDEDDDDDDEDYCLPKNDISSKVNHIL